MINKPIRSYARMSGRMTDAQKHAIASDSPYVINSIDPIEVSSDRQLVCEIGFGMGASLVEMAANQPEADFIGIEVYKPGVASSLIMINERGITNLKVMQADAVVALPKILPLGGIDRVQIFFPDPWHKKRHNKSLMFF